MASRREERVQKAVSVDHHRPGDARLSAVLNPLSQTECGYMCSRKRGCVDVFPTSIVFVVLEFLCLRLLPSRLIAAVGVGLPLGIHRARLGKRGHEAAAWLGEFVEEIHRSHGEHSGGERSAKSESGKASARGQATQLLGIVAARRTCTGGFFESDLPPRFAWDGRFRIAGEFLRDGLLVGDVLVGETETPDRGSVLGTGEDGLELAPDLGDLVTPSLSRSFRSLGWSFRVMGWMRRRRYYLWLGGHDRRCNRRGDLLRYGRVGSGRKRSATLSDQVGDGLSEVTVEIRRVCRRLVRVPAFVGLLATGDLLMTRVLASSVDEHVQPGVEPCGVH